MTNKIHNDKGAIVKEQVSFRVAPEVRELMEQIAASEHRTMANLTEKLVLERLRDIGLLDDDFKPTKEK
jgi:hypothetical protein